ncbi:hypothetical protein HDU81_010903 [Chytriomyces hyalinus]|nr:hypothetical protein HDU81_010903 [Chytriomyces hyalinus]
MHFSAGMDIDLLKEVVNEEPFAASHGAVTGAWVTVASNLNTVWDLDQATAGVTGPMCQKRFKVLMDVFRKEELDALKASGTAEEYGQREQLLTDLAGRMEEAEDERRDRRDKKLEDIEKREINGNIVREAAVARLSDKVSDALSEASSDQEPQKKRKYSRRESGNSSDLVEAIAEIAAAIAPATGDAELKKRKLELEESKLAFEREKFMAELEEQRKEKLFEREERRKERDERDAHNKQMMEMFQLLAKRI